MLPRIVLSHIMPFVACRPPSLVSEKQGQVECPCTPLPQDVHEGKHFLRQIGAIASPSLQQEISVLSQYLISLQVRKFLDNLSHMSEYIPSQPSLLYIFLQTHLLCAWQRTPIYIPQFSFLRAVVRASKYYFSMMLPSLPLSLGSI